MTPIAAAVPSVERIRAAFPALAGETVFLENAGGSQVPGIVADRIRAYMLESYVQVGAEYGLSRRATAVVEEAHGLAARMVNAPPDGAVILGASSTALCAMLAGCYRGVLEPGDEIVVAESGHETNAGPWFRLAAEGITVRTWPLDPTSMRCRIEDLEPLLGPRTRLVAFPHVSNLLGEIADVPTITAMAHEAGARVVVDGVAYAPHRAIDVQGWNVDWYFFSTYKVYGPHMACLYGRADALEGLPRPNHFFIRDDEVPYAFEPGGVSHEACAALLATGDYLRFLAGREDGGPVTRPEIERAFELMETLETPLIARLVDHLGTMSDVRIIGPAHAEPTRVGTVSFVHAERPSAAIARAVTERGIGIRAGHMYAYRLCKALGLDPEDGVVRVSLVHYNTLAEIDRLVAVLDEVMA